MGIFTYQDQINNYIKDNKTRKKKLKFHAGDLVFVSNEDDSNIKSLGIIEHGNYITGEWIMPDYHVFILESQEVEQYVKEDDITLIQSNFTYNLKLSLFKRKEFEFFDPRGEI